MHTLSSSLAAAALLVSCAFSAQAATQFIAVGQPLPRLALLKPGTHHYLRYLKDGESNTPIDIWTRTVSIEPRGMRIRQRWDQVGKTTSTKWIDSWVDTATMRPLTHERITEKDGKRVVEGFAFAPDKITGLKDLADNTQKDLAVVSPEPTFNFEIDIEFLQTLPLAQGYEAQINFYHPGGSAAPARYTFKVAGSATVGGPSGDVDCWIVTTDYNRPGSLSTFWFAKATQLMVRQESDMAPGKVLVKTMID